MSSNFCKRQPWMLSRTVLLFFTLFFLTGSAASAQSGDAAAGQLYTGYCPCRGQFRRKNRRAELGRETDDQQPKYADGEWLVPA